MTQLTISEARKEFLNLPEKLAREPERAVITDQDNPLLSELASFRGVRTVGQKYRIVYRVDRQSHP